MQYLIVSIPDLCPLSCFEFLKFKILGSLNFHPCFCFSLCRPEYPEEELEEENIIEDDAELTVNKVDDTVFGVSGITVEPNYSAVPL